MKTNPVGWFEIYVDDMSRAKSFYETVFDGPLTQLPAGGLDMWVFPSDCNTTGCTGALVQMEGCKAGGGSTIVYFKCDDCAVEESRVAPAGGKVFKPKFSIGEYGFISLVFDTEGNMIGLHSTV